MAVLILSANNAVGHSVNIASALRFPPLMIGLIVVSMGTDFPEMVNSFVSSSLGHGDINVGDSFGSVLAQMTLIFGLVALVGRQIKVDRNVVMTLGAAEILALIASLSMVEKGYITLMNAFFLVVSWPILLLLTRSIAKDPGTTSLRSNRRLSYQSCFSCSSLRRSCSRILHCDSISHCYVRSLVRSRIFHKLLRDCHWNIPARASS